jgi:biotin carboxylase
MPPEAESVVVLGGNEDHATLVESLRQRGYRVVVVDPNPHAQAGILADLHERSDAFDEEEVERIAREVGAVAVMSLCVDYGFRVACSVSERLGLRAPLEGEWITKVFDKAAMKSLLRESGIRVARSVTVPIDGGLPTLPSNDGGPVVVKPVDSHGSRGVVHVMDRGHLESAIRVASTESRTNRVLIEEQVEGSEISIDCLIVDGRPHILMVSLLRRVESSPSSRLIIAAVAGSSTVDTADQNLQDTIEHICSTFGFPDGPLLIQAFLSPDGILIGEVSPRVGGGAKAHDIEWSVGLNPVRIGAALWLGRRVDVEPRRSTATFARLFIYTEPGTIRRFVGVQEALDQGRITDFRCNRRLGEGTLAARSSAGRVASCRVAMSRDDDPDDRCRLAVEGIDVIGDGGSSLIRWDLLGRTWF